ncbi:MAG TPA: hypothetical protein VF540_12660, partial [Segetibacter sp.]
LAEQSVVQGTLINDAVNNHTAAEEELAQTKVADVSGEQNAVSEMIVADNGELIEKSVAAISARAPKIPSKEISGKLNASDKKDKTAEHIADNDNPGNGNTNDLSNDKKEEE